MRVILQRVSEASVTVDEKIIGKIGNGLLILAGFGKDDTEENIDAMVNKILKLRVFSDENDKINLSVTDISGELLAVSQFTLYWNCKKGTRPSFDGAMEPKRAEELYDIIVEKLRQSGLKTETGSFGADMKVALINDGPVTVELEI